MVFDTEQAALIERRGAGADDKISAGMCPYSHQHLALRMSWMKGFGEGRERLKQEGEPGRPASTLPAAPDPH